MSKACQYKQCFMAQATSLSQNNYKLNLHNSFTLDKCSSFDYSVVVNRVSYQHSQLSEQTESAVSTARVSCQHSQSQLSAQSQSAVSTVRVSCQHSQSQLSAQSESAVSTVRVSCQHSQSQLSAAID